MAADLSSRPTRRARRRTSDGGRTEQVLRQEQVRIQQLETYAADLRATYGELRRTLQRMTLLHEVSMRITAALDPQEVASALLESVTQIVTCQSARLYLEESSQPGSAVAAPRTRLRVTPASPTGLATRTAEESTARQALALGQTYVQESQRGGHDAAIPLRAGRQVFGALVLHVAEPLSDPDVQLVEQLTAFAGVALENAYLYQETQRLATTDPLTGLSNYRAFVQALDLEVQRARRMGYSLGLLMLDMDHFKNVNDRFGHPAGDEALRQVAAVLRRHLRRTDVLGRLGGEEFAVLLPGGTLESLETVGEKLRQAVEALPPVTDGVNTHRFTVSVGGAALPCDRVDARLLVSCADRALYRAKHDGRNRVHLWTDDSMAELALPNSSPPTRFELPASGSTPAPAGHDQGGMRESGPVLP